MTTVRELYHTKKAFNFPLRVVQCFDLCLAWNWEYDADFVSLLESAFSARGLSLLQITPNNLQSVMDSLSSNELWYRVFFDRASDTDERFLPLELWAIVQGAARINPYHLARPAWNKTEMDEKFTQAGLNTPAAIVLPAYHQEPELPPLNLDCLGEKFAIKPAHGGGGKGVWSGATTWEQVCAARQEFPGDRYLLQAHVSPALLGSRPAWFRVLYFAGQVFPCWWDPCTHVYTPVSESEEYSLALQPLRLIAAEIHLICGLTLFSTEIALTSDGRFMVIDHVNDPIDLRLQSKTPDGMPDEIAMKIANGLADFTINVQ